MKNSPLVSARKINVLYFGVSSLLFNTTLIFFFLVKFIVKKCTIYIISAIIMLNVTQNESYLIIKLSAILSYVTNRLFIYFSHIHLCHSVYFKIKRYIFISEITV